MGTSSSRMGEDARNPFLYTSWRKLITACQAESARVHKRYAQQSSFGPQSHDCRRNAVYVLPRQNSLLCSSCREGAEHGVSI